MEAKFQVFISSTSRDLPDYRDAVINACLDANMHPIAMEHFQPENANALQVCYDALHQADVLVGIYAHRYGYAPPASVSYTDKDNQVRSGDGVTGITEWEYMWAQEHDMPILIFVVDEDADWKYSDIEHTKKAQLDAFKAKVGTALVYKTFTDIHDFRVKIISALKDDKTKKRMNLYALGRKPTPEQAKIQEQHAKDSDIQPPPSPVIEKIRRVGSLPKLFTQDDFFDRDSQQADITNAIRTGKALIAVYGRGGVGKTALMCKVLGDFEKHTEPADGLAYFRANDTQTTLTAGEILAGLSRFLPPDHPFHETRKDITLSVADKTRAFIEAVQGGRYIVYIDNLESIQFTTPEDEPPSPDEGHIIPADMRDFLATVLALGDNRGMSVVITSRVPLPFGKNPLFFNPLHSGAIKPLRLDEGLPLDEGIAFMKSMKHHDNLPDDAQLALWHAKVNGFPRGLEALIGYLNQSETRHIQDLLDDPRLFGENVLSEIVGKVIATLSTPLKQILGAVSVIGQATSQADLEYALAPHVNTAYLRHALDYLVDGRYLAYNGQTRTYSLHPLDMAYIRETLLPEGEKLISEQGERYVYVRDETAFTRYALAYRMAKLYEQKRRPASEWRDLNDLTAHLREMEYRLILGDYDTVASIFVDIDYKLYKWGYTQLVLDWHNQIDGKVENLTLAMQCMDTLGTIHNDIGNHQKALEYIQKALAIADRLSYKQTKGNLIGMLGIIYKNLGQIGNVITYYEQSLSIARELSNQPAESFWLGKLGAIHERLGQNEKALHCYNLSLKISREINDEDGQAKVLSNLGFIYKNLGQFDKSITCYKHALILSRKVINKRDEGYHLGSLGSVLTVIGDYAEAIHYLLESVKIVNTIQSPDLIQSKISSLAHAYWFSNKIDDALTSIHQARQHNNIINNHWIASLHGCIAYCMGQTDEAQTAFRDAIAYADVLLVGDARQYDPLYSKALALAGLWLVTGDDAYQAQAQTAYDNAKTVNRGAGVLLENRQKLEKLLACGQRDGSGLLALLV